MSGSYRPDDHPTEVSGGSDADQTRPLPSTGSRHADGGAWEAEVPARSGQPTSSTYDTYDPAGEQGPTPPSRGRQIAIGLLSAILGFVLAFVVIALTTDDADVTDPGDAEAQQRIEALQSELAERDMQIDQLEARLAETEAAAGETDADLQAQSQALDERAAALDQRAEALDDREAALDEREAAIAERESEADADPGADPGTEDPQPDDDPDGGLTPPDLDEEDVQNIVDRVLERLRDLFN